jgi:hemerythrin
MSMFQWKEEYRVGHSEMDTQHKRLFQLAGDLDAAITEGKDSAVLSQALTNLIEYTKHHFACEELLMQNYHYPDFPLHKTFHDDLTERVMKFQESFAAGGTTTAVELSGFLDGWLGHHIDEPDRNVAVFLKAYAA